MFNFRETNSIRSEYVSTGKFKFYIKAKLSQNEEDKEYYLGFFLECETDEPKK
jgi:hypothetical protein